MSKENQASGKEPEVSAKVSAAVKRYKASQHTLVEPVTCLKVTSSHDIPLPQPLSAWFQAQKDAGLLIEL